MTSAPDSPTDDPLLERARAGDREAIEALVERHQAQVYRFGLKMCRNPEDAKDVTQETLLAMARNVGDFRGASSISTWLYTIARNFCIKMRRKSKHAPDERSLETDVAREAARLDHPSKRPDEALAQKQLEHALEQAIAELEPKYRDTLVLRDVEGLTAPDVAEVLGISVPAVKSRLHRARLAVRTQLAPMLDGDHPSLAPTPSCPDVLTLFSQHLEDEISAEVCAEMERHLEECERCRGTCDSLKQTLTLCRTSADAIEVPTSIQASVKVALESFLTDFLADKG